MLQFTAGLNTLDATMKQKRRIATRENTLFRMSACIYVICVTRVLSSSVNHVATSVHTTEETEKENEQQCLAGGDILIGYNTSIEKQWMIINLEKQWTIINLKWSI